MVQEKLMSPISTSDKANCRRNIHITLFEEQPNFFNGIHTMVINPKLKYSKQKMCKRERILMK